MQLQGNNWQLCDSSGAICKGIELDTEFVSFYISHKDYESFSLRRKGAGIWVENISSSKLTPLIKMAR